MTQVAEALTSEQQVIGSVLIAPKYLPAVERMLTELDFADHRHQKLWNVLTGMRAAGKAIDALTVDAEAAALGFGRESGGALYLHELTSSVVTPANVEYHAELVRDASRRRSAWKLGQRIQQIAAEIADPDRMADALARESIALDLFVNDQGSDAPVEDLQSWDDFINRHGGVARKWVIPGVISSSDVWMILAPMGAGKTTLSRQVAWCAAAGINPFNPLERFEPKRSLVVDLENDPGEAADESSSYLAQVKRLGDFDPDRAQVWSHVEGLNVRTRAGAQLLERAVAQARPDIVCLGSLNNVYSKGGSDWDTCADEVRAVFNSIRKRYGCALWLEHHMAKAVMGTASESPYGSMIWAAWATHGRVLSRAVDNPASPFVFRAPFRGDRGKRDAPVGFYRGGKLPWTAIHDPGELEILTEAAQ